MLLLLLVVGTGRQAQLAELRMQMMHMQSKKNELEHNIPTVVIRP